MKRFLCIIFVVIIMLSMIGCGAPEASLNVNVNNNGVVRGSVFGKDAMIELGSGLWYDSTTKIIYWWNGNVDSFNHATTPSPYYAPNGLPYRYNPQTNTFEEIELGRG